jgi:hypothetical protein
MMPSEPSWLFTLAMRTHRPGALIGAEALFTLDDEGTIRAGPYAQYAFYWAELGAKIQGKVARGLLVGGLSLGAEPGVFIRSEELDESRTPGIRAVARARAELNLRSERVWLYSRSTAVGRLRSFEERDPHRDVVLDRELSGEEALALLVAPHRFGERGAVWVYAEWTIAGAIDVGLLDNRPSVGAIVEDLWPGFTFDLDLYYSLREGALEGFGVLLYVWWRP